MLLTVALTAMFISVAVGAGTLTHVVLARQAPARRRLRELVRADAQAERAVRGASPSALTAAPHPFAVRLAALLPRSATRLAEIRQRLAGAGYRGSSAPVIFTATQVALALVAAVVLFGVGGADGLRWAAMGAIGGAVLPEVWLKNRRQLREQAIGNGMSDTMDLLVVCLEAGCSLDQALLKSSEELRLSRPEMADEIGLIINEVRAGRSRADAFRHFATRVGLEEVRALVSILVQTDRYGTSLTQALRAHGDLCRTRRRQRAEERAGKASVKMVFPLVLCLFPAFFLIALGPTVVEFYRSLTQLAAK